MTAVSPGGITARGAFARHVLAVLAVVVVVALAVLVQGSRAATAQAERAAAANVRTIALGFGLPLGAHDLAATGGGTGDATAGGTGDGDWRAVLAEVVDPALEEGQVLAVHLWERADDGRGRVVWSTDPDALGTVAEVGDGEDAWRLGATTVERLDEGTTSLGPRVPDLYEAYLGVTDRTGTVYVLEVYKPVRQYGAIRASLLREWLPTSLGGVLLVGLVTLPLSLRLARRAAHAEAARVRLAERAARARSEERLRIGAALHERALQDLAAAGLLLDTVREQVPDGQARAVVDRVAGMLAADVRELRAVVEEEHPVPDGVADDLEGDVRAWAEHVGLTGAGVRLDVRLPHVDLAPAVASAARTTLREGLRNVAKHAGASAVTVDGVVVEEVDGRRWLRLRVQDDGRGPGAVVDGVGLTVVRGLAGSVDGHVEVRRAEAGTGVGADSGGTLLEVVFPVSPVSPVSPVVPVVPVATAPPAATAPPVAPTVAGTGTGSGGVSARQRRAADGDPSGGDELHDDRGGRALHEQQRDEDEQLGGSGLHR